MSMTPFEKWYAKQTPPVGIISERDWNAGYQAAIATVKEGGEVAWQNTRNGFICKEQSAEYQHPLYKLPED